MKVIRTINYLLLTALFAFTVFLMALFSTSFNSKYASDYAQYSKQFNDTVAYVQAPKNRLDISGKERSGFSQLYQSYITQAQLDAVNNLDYIESVYPLSVDTSITNLDNASIVSGITGTLSAGKNSYDVNVTYHVLPSEIDNSSLTYPKAIKGTTPVDNQPQIYVSDQLSKVNVGDKVKLDEVEYTVSGKFASDTNQVYVSYNSDNVDAINAQNKQLLTDQGVSLADGANGYGDVEIQFTSTPTADQLAQVQSLLPGSLVYNTNGRLQVASDFEMLRITLLSNLNIIAILALVALVFQFTIKLLKVATNQKTFIRERYLAPIILIFGSGIYWIYADVWNRLIDGLPGFGAIVETRTIKIFILILFGLIYMLIIAVIIKLIPLANNQKVKNEDSDELELEQHHVEVESDDEQIPDMLPPELEDKTTELNPEDSRVRLVSNDLTQVIVPDEPEFVESLVMTPNEVEEEPVPDELPAQTAIDETPQPKEEVKSEKKKNRPLRIIMLVIKYILIAVVALMVFIATIFTISHEGFSNDKQTAFYNLKSQYRDNIALITSPDTLPFLNEEQNAIVRKEITPYVTQDEVDALNKLDYVTGVYGLPDTNINMPLHNAKVDVLKGKTKINAQVTYPLLPSSTWYEKNKDSMPKFTNGTYPKDNSNEIAVSSGIKKVKIGDTFTIDGQAFKVSATFKSSAQQIYLPFSDQYYQKYLMANVREQLKTKDGIEIDDSTPVYTTVAIVTDKMPEAKQVNEMQELVPNAPILHTNNWIEIPTSDLFYSRIAIRQSFAYIAISVAIALVVGIVIWTRHMRIIELITFAVMLVVGSAIFQFKFELWNRGLMKLIGPNAVSNYYPNSLKQLIISTLLAGLALVLVIFIFRMIVKLLLLIIRLVKGNKTSNKSNSVKEEPKEKELEEPVKELETKQDTKED